MEGIVIEKMKESDLPAVLAIENVSFPTPFTESLFRMELNLNVAHLYVAKKESRIVGYVDFWRVGPEMHLITIAVHPEFRKLHIGSALVEFMIDNAKTHRVEHISLDVRPSNGSGMALYEKYGFRQTGLRKGYYQDNQEDALVLGLTLVTPLDASKPSKTSNSGQLEESADEKKS
jgi:ribosomal-protein-alanine N-acetyltransferase